MERHDRIAQSLLHSGFLAVVIAWHELVLEKTVILSPFALMVLAGCYWLLAGLAFMLRNSSRILQREITGAPPIYYYILVVPFCIYTAIAPWALLQMLGAIRAPATTVFATIGL